MILWIFKVFLLLCGTFSLISCSGKKSSDNAITNKETMDMNNYAYNRGFLKEKVRVIELKHKESAILLVPDWQGRVMTSTAEGEEGYSFGWINRELIASGLVQPHINAFGGEERLWLGPEGGQFSIFFKKGSPFTFEHWQTPEFLDTSPFFIEKQDERSVQFVYDGAVENYSGNVLQFSLKRKVELLSETELRKLTGINCADLKFVAYRSENKIINTGDKEWTRQTGMLSIWMLGMYIPSPELIVCIPVREGDTAVYGRQVNDNYFGKIGPERLKVSASHVFFRADGKSRGKIGISPLRSKGIMGSYDKVNNALTLLICKVPEGITEYVNSAWEIQRDPFSGDAMNSYNDGPLEDGSQMGPFYELESSSPAAALKPDSSLTHSQVTIHLTGNRSELNEISLLMLGLSLAEIERVFN
jgi:hypothetical protein